MHMSQPVRTVAPAADLVTRVEAIQQTREESGERDGVLDRLIAAAAAHLDGYAGIVGRCLVNQTWQVGLSSWPPDGCIRLPFPDVSSVVVTYRDADDAEQTLSASLYEVVEDALGSRIRLKNAFASPSLYDDREFPVTVTLVAGYGAAATAVPASIRTAALMLIAHWYDNPDGGTEIPDGLKDRVSSLVAPHRRTRI